MKKYISTQRGHGRPLRGATADILEDGVPGTKGDAQGNAKSGDSEYQDEAKDLDDEAATGTEDNVPGGEPGQGHIQRAAIKQLAWTVKGGGANMQRHWYREYQQDSGRQRSHGRGYILP